MRVAFGVAGAAGIWQRNQYLTEDGGGILILLGCVVALVLGLWWVVETGILMFSPVARFKSASGELQELGDKFAERAEDGDGPGFREAVRGMHRVSRKLATVQVHLNINTTESDDREVVAGVARENRDELLALAYLVAESNLGEARRVRPR